MIAMGFYTRSWPSSQEDTTSNLTKKSSCGDSLKEHLTDYIEASTILGKDEDFRRKVESMRSRLQGPQIVQQIETAARWTISQLKQSTYFRITTLTIGS